MLGADADPGVDEPNLEVATRVHGLGSRERCLCLELHVGQSNRQGSTGAFHGVTSVHRNVQKRTLQRSRLTPNEDVLGVVRDDQVNSPIGRPADESGQVMDQLANFDRRRSGFTVTCECGQPAGQIGG